MMRFTHGVNILVVLVLGLALFGCRNTVPATVDSENPGANEKTPESSSSGPSKPQTIKFESSGKVEIIGTYYESAKSDSAAVLLLHQYGSNRKSYEDFALRLQASGIAVLAIDGRGFGESVKTTDGKSIGPGRTDESVKGMIADVDGGFEFLAKQDLVDKSRIGIVGASYGSSLALMYSAENTNVRAVVLLSPGLNYFGNMPTEPAVKSFGDRPLLLVAAEDDKASADTVRKLAATGGSQKHETQVYPKGGHGTNLFGAKVGLEDLMENFLRKNL